MLSSLFSTYSTLVMVPLSSRPSSFDHLVGTLEQRGRNFEAKCILGLEIDHKLELGRLLDRQVTGPFTLEDAIDIGCCLPVCLEQLNPIRHQTAAGDEVAGRIDRRQAVPGGERDDRSTVRRGEEVRQHEERAIGCARKLLDYVFHLVRIMNRRGKRL